MSYRPEPPFAHDRVAKVGVLIVNLGTPEAPTPAAVRAYLGEFLTDPRVVEIPSFAWRPLLHGVVLRVRPAKSAARYELIWTKDGSPLAIHTRKQKVLLSGALGQRMKAQGFDAEGVVVDQAMRYGRPSIGDGIDRLRAAACERILVVPLYPQYSASTTGSVVDAVGTHLATLRRVPGLRIIDTYHDDPGYVGALAAHVNEYWMRHGRPEHLVLSFHGLPRRALARGDPYHCYCQATARLLARELGVEPSQWTIAFQSRFGRGRWLEPATANVLAKLGGQRLRRVDVFAPGFVADCLETLEELAIEGKRTYQAAGGGDYHVLPCLNEHPRFIAALTDLVMANLHGWLAPRPDAAAREATKLRARALGASA
ncbi:MAG TPA: ferrochelatase [Casimicrobiaceae bacterium]|nr:ferrochelatase [Casimicrobiaceae bacterium]